jgi:hypothetical protein
VVVIKKKHTKWLIIIFALILVLLSYGIYSLSSKNKHVDIYNIVKEAFLTENGYSVEISNRMTKEVFERINAYNRFGGLNNRPEIEKPFKIDFSLKEDSQKAKRDIIYVQMTYTIKIWDSNNKVAGSSKDIPITFTVKKTGNEWYIIDTHEPA